jgi:D-lactate dehydrogenase (cytochrome)
VALYHRPAERNAAAVHAQTAGLHRKGTRTLTIDPKYLSDAAHFPGGHAAGIVAPRSTQEVQAIVRNAASLLPIGAQSSLTGGATPMGELVLSTEKLTRILSAGSTHATVAAGVSIAVLQATLAEHGAWFPAAPTFTGAVAGGVVATNAAGAATFKYGSVRAWVDALVVVLADGSELSVRRGQYVADDRMLRVPTAAGVVGVRVPSYRMPDVVKRSAGYHAAPGMDLIDLFIGSEGTLGVITQVTFRAVSPAPTTALALVPCRSEAAALALVADLRRASADTWRSKDVCGIDAAAIEHMDHRSIEILREDGADRRNDVGFPDGIDVALLVQLELPAGTSASDAFDQIQAAATSSTDGSLVRFCRLLSEHDLLDDTELALPGNPRRAEQLIAVREAVPAGVNQRVGRAQRDVDPRIAKTAADMIVPFDRFADMMDVYRGGFRAHGLDFAVWGHISDGNVHPNVLPRSYDEMERGKDAILQFGHEVGRLGGCPLAEHGVGRSPVKQALLRGLYGAAGIDEMREVKRTLDPEWKLAPGVIFTR